MALCDEDNPSLSTTLLFGLRNGWFEGWLLLDEDVDADVDADVDVDVDADVGIELVKSMSCHISVHDKHGVVLSEVLEEIFIGMPTVQVSALG